MARRFVLASTLVTGCAFTGQPGGAPGSEPDGGGEAALRTCTAPQPADVRLCIDFEDPSLAARALDGSGRLNDAIATNITPLQRSAEQAAQLVEYSSLQVAESAALDLATLTIEMWIRPDMLPPDRRAAGLLDNFGQYEMQLGSDGRLRCALGGDRSADSRSTLALGAWHHVACRYDGTEMRAYVDGELGDCSRIGPAVTAPTAGTAIGARIAPAGGFRDHFIGGLDNVRVYSGPIDEARLCAAAGHMGCRFECRSRDDGHDHSGGD